jgi:hypothetical protein
MPVKKSWHGAETAHGQVPGTCMDVIERENDRIDEKCRLARKGERVT